MPNVMLTVVLDPSEASVARVRRKLRLASDQIDRDFGVVSIRPDQHLYAILVDERAAARLRHHKGVHGPFANPSIAPFGPPEVQPIVAPALRQARAGEQPEREQPRLRDDARARELGPSLPRRKRGSRRRAVATETDLAERDYAAEVAELEQRADEQAPGVLELLEVYGRLLPEPPDWRHVHASMLTYGTGANPPR